jgi:hypothetical protein
VPGDGDHFFANLERFFFRYALTTGCGRERMSERNVQAPTGIAEEHGGDAAFHPAALITAQHQCFQTMHLSRDSICVSICTQDSGDMGTKVKRIGDKAMYKATRTRSG